MENKFGTQQPYPIEKVGEVSNGVWGARPRAVDGDQSSTHEKQRRKPEKKILTHPSRGSTL